MAEADVTGAELHDEREATGRSAFRTSTDLALPRGLAGSQESRPPEGMKVGRSPL
jgi:hypothetical protein